VQLELVGTQSERNATGAIVRVTRAQERWVSSASVGDGYYGTNQRLIHVGLGTADQIDRLEIVWPSGQIQSTDNVQADRRYRWIEGAQPHEIELAN
jgi:hypothetical protein